MEISKAKCEAILKTLPVGYYLFHNCSVTMTDEDATYCNPETETVCVSYPMVSMLAKKIKDEDPDEVEKDIRSLLYHEISHLILTPLQLAEAIEAVATHYHTPVNLVHNIVNIVEDERIETILSKYYFAVNFKELVYKLNDPDVTDTPIAKFFDLVRFHKGSPDLLEALDRLMTKYNGLTRRSGYSGCIDYVTNCYGLYWRLIEDMAESADSESAKSTSSEPSTGEPNTGESTSDSVDIPKLPYEDALEGAFNDKDLKKICATIFELKESAEVTEKIKRILINRRNRLSNQASGTFTYAGRINPRACGIRDDYRWFAKATGRGSEKMFDKIKINLFVDISGSFMSSQEKINAIIMSLTHLEKEFPDFSFDVIAMGNENNVRKHGDRSVRCDEGNWLTDTIYPCWKKVQTPNASNYNIVVFDGDAQSFDGAGMMKRDELRDQFGHVFDVFNHPNCVVISDTSNKKKLLRYAPDCKKVIIDSDYADRLQDEVLVALTRLLSR